MDKDTDETSNVSLGAGLFLAGLGFIWGASLTLSFLYYMEMICNGAR